MGPGACYQAERLIGVEIKPEEAARAERNVRLVDPTGVARILAADAVDVAAGFPGDIGLLYLDADGDAARGKGIYYDILQACYDRLPTGAVVLAHNSVNCAERLEQYLKWVRDPAHLRASVNVILDGEGLEVSAALAAIPGIPGRANAVRRYSLVRPSKAKERRPRGPPPPDTAPGGWPGTPA